MENEKKAPVRECERLENAIILNRIQTLIQVREQLIKEIDFVRDTDGAYTAIEIAFMNCIKQEVQRLET